MEVPVGEPKTIEQVAMDKVIDPFSEPFPLWHSIWRFKNFREILKDGIIAGDFASRIKKDNYASDFGSSWNSKFVSLSRGDSSGSNFPSRIAVLVEPTGRVVKASETQKQESDQHSPMEDEYLAANRIAPKEFKGILIERPDYISLDSVLAVLQEEQMGLPVYTTEGLVWPVVMTREELKERAKAA